MDRLETPLQFAVRFAQMDLSQLREGDWLNLREDLHARFFEGGQAGRQSDYDANVTGGIRALPRKDPRKLTSKELRALQVKCKELVNAWAMMQTRREGERHLRDSREVTKLVESLQRRRIPTLFPGRISMQYIPQAYRDGSSGVIAVAELTPLFLFTLSMMLQRGGAETLRVCSECGKLLSKRGRRKYCSPKCLDRVTKRTYRKNKKAGAHADKKK